MAVVNARRDVTGNPPAPARPAPRVSPYELIKQAILSGELAPGQPLVETTLATWCGVSRTPVREALRRLEQDGLVERSSHGMAVRARSPEQILDLYDIRIVLEATAAKFAADRRTEHDVRSLRWIIQRSESVPATDPAAMVDANRQFHRAVWQATHNEPLIDLLERLDLHLARYPETTLASDGRWDTARREHLDLANAIEGRNGSLAQEIATRHFAAARDIRLRLFAEETQDTEPVSLPASLRPPSPAGHRAGRPRAGGVATVALVMAAPIGCQASGKASAIPGRRALLALCVLVYICICRCLTRRDLASMKNGVVCGTR